jgi:hypothetical protein
MADRLERITAWLRDQGGSGAVANARGELERRDAEQALLAALEGRVVPVAAPEPAAA